jgi:hypothetical protein
MIGKLKRCLNSLISFTLKSQLVLIRIICSWKLRQHGNFDVKSFYHALDVRSELSFPWRPIWKVKAPRRLSFFLWSAAWGSDSYL